MREREMMSKKKTHFLKWGMVFFVLFCLVFGGIIVPKDAYCATFSLKVHSATRKNGEKMQAGSIIEAYWTSVSDATSCKFTIREKIGFHPNNVFSYEGEKSSNSISIPADTLKHGTKYVAEVTVYSPTGTFSDSLDFSTDYEGEPGIISINLVSGYNIGEKFQIKGGVSGNGEVLEYVGCYYKIVQASYSQLNPSEYGYVFEEYPNSETFDFSKYSGLVIGTDLPLAATNEYELVIVARCAGGETKSVYKKEISISLPKEDRLPENFDFYTYDGGETIPYDSELQIKWTNSSYADKYTITLKNITTGTETSYDTGAERSYTFPSSEIDPGCQYQIIVTASNKNGDYQKQLTLYTAAADQVINPVLASFDIGDLYQFGDEFKIDGRAISNGDYIKLARFYYTDESGNIVEVSRRELTGLTEIAFSKFGTYTVGQDIFMTPGKYTIYVTAKNRTSEEIVLAEKSILVVKNKPTEPTLLVPEKRIGIDESEYRTLKDMDIQWKKSENADYYIVSVVKWKGEEVVYSKTITNTNTTSLTIPGSVIDEEGYYDFQVYAYENTNGLYAYDIKYVFFMEDDTLGKYELLSPSSSEITNYSGDELKLVWTTPEHVYGYTIYVTRKGDANAEQTYKLSATDTSCSIDTSNWYLEDKYTIRLVANGYGDQTKSKIITVTTAGRNNGEFEQDIQYISVGYNGNDNKDCVTQNLYLPKKGAISGNEITWTSSNPEIVAINGKYNEIGWIAEVTRPKTSTSVLLTATISNYNTTKNVYFDITVSGTSGGEAEIKDDPTPTSNPTPTPTSTDVPAPVGQNLSVPAEITIGDKFDISGIVDSNGGTLRRIHIHTYYIPDNNYCYVNADIVDFNGGTTYDLSQIGTITAGNEFFGKAGTYLFNIEAGNIGGAGKTLLQKTITVKEAEIKDNPAPTSTDVPAPVGQNLSVPTEITIGDKFDISGIVDSNGGNLRRIHIHTYYIPDNNYCYVNADIVDFNGGTTYDLSQIGTITAGNEFFGKAGTYLFNIEAGNVGGAGKTLLQKTITVKEAEVPTEAPIVTPIVTPIEEPVITPVITPVSTPIITPAITPSYPSYDIPVYPIPDFSGISVPGYSDVTVEEDPYEKMAREDIEAIQKVFAEKYNTPLSENIEMVKFGPVHSTNISWSSTPIGYINTNGEIIKVPDIDTRVSLYPVASCDGKTYKATISIVIAGKNAPTVTESPKDEKSKSDNTENEDNSGKSISITTTEAKGGVSVSVTNNLSQKTLKKVKYSWINYYQKTINEKTQKEKSTLVSSHRVEGVLSSDNTSLVAGNYGVQVTYYDVDGNEIVSASSRFVVNTTTALVQQDDSKIGILTVTKEDNDGQAIISITNSLSKTKRGNVAYTWINYYDRNAANEIAYSHSVSGLAKSDTPVLAKGKYGVEVVYYNANGKALASGSAEIKITKQEKATKKEIAAVKPKNLTVSSKVKNGTVILNIENDFSDAEMKSVTKTIINFYDKNNNNEKYVAPEQRGAAALCTMSLPAGEYGIEVVYYAQIDGCEQAIASSNSNTVKVKLSINDDWFNTSLIKGQGYNLNGKIGSLDGIKSITASITNSKLKDAVEICDGKKTYTLKGSNLDNKVLFNKLAVGEYVLVITVEDINGLTVQREYRFAVRKEIKPYLSGKEDNKQYNVEEGGMLRLNGVVRADFPLNSVNIYVTANAYSELPIVFANIEFSQAQKMTEYDISNLVVDTSEMEPGEYVIHVFAQNDGVKYPYIYDYEIATAELHINQSKNSKLRDKDGYNVIPDIETQLGNKSILSGMITGSEKIESIKFVVEGKGIQKETNVSSLKSNKFTFTDVELDTRKLKKGKYTINVYVTHPNSDEEFLAGYYELNVIDSVDEDLSDLDDKESIKVKDLTSYFISHRDESITLGGVVTANSKITELKVKSYAGTFSQSFTFTPNDAIFDLANIKLKIDEIIIDDRNNAKLEIWAKTSNDMNWVLIASGIDIIVYHEEIEIGKKAQMMFETFNSQKQLKKSKKYTIGEMEYTLYKYNGKDSTLEDLIFYVNNDKVVTDKTTLMKLESIRDILDNKESNAKKLRKQSDDLITVTEACNTIAGLKYGTRLFGKGIGIWASGGTTVSSAITSELKALADGPINKIFCLVTSGILLDYACYFEDAANKIESGKLTKYEDVAEVIQKNFEIAYTLSEYTIPYMMYIYDVPKDFIEAYIDLLCDFTDGFASAFGISTKEASNMVKNGITAYNAAETAYKVATDNQKEAILKDELGLFSKYLEELSDENIATALSQGVTGKSLGLTAKIASSAIDGMNALNWMSTVSKIHNVDFSRLFAEDFQSNANNIIGNYGNVDEDSWKTSQSAESAN